GQSQVLVNGGNAQCERVSRAVNAHRLSLKKKLAVIGLVCAGYDFDKCGLASAIIAHQRLNLASIDAEIYLVQRAQRAEVFAYSLECQQWLTGVRQLHLLRYWGCTHLKLFSLL